MLSVEAPKLTSGVEINHPVAMKLKLKRSRRP